MTSTFLISGAGRGIGLSLVKALLALDITRIVFAGVRNVAIATELRSIAQADERVVLFPLDVDDDGSISNAARIVAAQSPSLSVLFNCAGFAPDEPASAASVQSSVLLQAFRTNTLGPILLTQSLLPLLERAGGVVVNISSLLGTVHGNPGGHLAYAVSKAGLNMATAIFQKQDKERKVIFVAVDPGAIAVPDMEDRSHSLGAKRQAEPEESVEGILRNIVFSADVKRFAGTFATWEGTIILW